MPELIEVEQYRRQADAVVGRTIASFPVLDELYLRVEPEAVVAAAVGATVEATDRRGKLLLLMTDGPVLGLHFGMTGRLLVDGAASIDRLEYSSARDDPAWDRLVIRFTDGTDLRTRDPRRLGALALDPDLTRLGPDAATISTPDLARGLGSSRAPVKARLLDQRRVAGLGNLLVDETLWRAGFDPRRASGSLDRPDVRSLAAAIRGTVRLLTRRGGSHTGDLHEARHRGASCPRDGAPLRRDAVGGRTT